MTVILSYDITRSQNAHLKREISDSEPNKKRKLIFFGVVEHGFYNAIELHQDALPLYVKNSVVVIFN